MPYVISEDIKILIEKWTNSKNFVCPNDLFFVSLRKKMKKKLESIFGDCVQFVSEDDIVDMMKNLSEQYDSSMISIDKVYSSCPMKIEITRTMNQDMTEIFHHQRYGSDSIDTQFDLLCAKLPKEIVIVDDVIVTGDIIKYVVQQLQERSINVKQVFSGIAMQRGIDRLQEIGLSVSALVVYSDFIDEICERDFYPGIPFSGRSVISENRQISAPYIMPFGDPVAWASIPKEHALDFSIFCLKQAICLWEEIEKLSQRIIKCHDIERIPIYFELDDIPFVDKLKNVLSELTKKNNPNF